MSYTQADLDRLDAAIASSELEVELDGSRVRYRSVSELRVARDHVATVLARQPSQSSWGVMRVAFTTLRD
jgi:hypothetical protein